MLQHDQFAVVSRQQIQGGSEVVQVFWRLDDWRCRFERLMWAWAIPGTHALFEAAIAQKNVEPRVELARLIKPPQVPERVQEGALGHVGRVRIVAGQRSRMRERSALIPVNQMMKGLDLALSTPSDRLSVMHSLLHPLSGKRRKYSRAGKILAKGARLSKRQG